MTDKKVSLADVLWTSVLLAALAIVPPGLIGAYGASPGNAEDAGSLIVIWLASVGVGIVMSVLLQAREQRAPATRDDRTSWPLWLVVPAGVLTARLVPEMFGFPTYVLVAATIFGSGLPLVAARFPAQLMRLRKE